MDMPPPGFVALPSATFVIPKGGQTLHSITEAFVYWIALGMKATYERMRKDVYFVSMIALSETGTDFSVDFFCPYPDLIGFLKKNLHNGLSPKDAARMSNEFDYKMIRKMALNPDTPTPLLSLIPRKKKYSLSTRTR